MPSFKWGSGEGTFKKMKIKKKDGTKIKIYSILPQKQFDWISNVLCDDGTSSKSTRHEYIILYHSKSHGRVNLTDGTDPLYKQLLSRKACKYGKENIAVVLDHMGDDIDGMKTRIERSQRSVFKYAKCIFYFKNGSDEDEIQEKLKLKQFFSSTEAFSTTATDSSERENQREQQPSETGKTEKRRLAEPTEAVQQGTFKKMKIKRNKTAIRIYSLLPKKQFVWVVELLQDDSIVWPSSRHKYVILYHSKSHGRVNLTDGTDPLYNKFLPKKASKYGKENIVVVLDHLGDDIDGMKARIERSQRSVFKYAKYMFYFKNGSDEDEIQEKLKLKQFLSSTDNS